MKTTEKEAKTKWCPFARVLLPVRQSGNRIGTFHKRIADDGEREHYEEQEADCKCIGSGCMAWRWELAPASRVRLPEELAQASTEAEPPRPGNLPESWRWSPSGSDLGEACWSEPIEEASARTRGFCGLASRPGVYS